MIKIKKELFERSKEVSVFESILKDGNYTVKSKGSKNEWIVTKEGDFYFCSCPDYQKRKKECKHIISVMRYEGFAFECDEEKQEDKKENPETIKTKIKFDLDRLEVISAFHKELRRGDVKKAWYWIEAMIQSDFGQTYINDYIISMIGKELCLCDMDIITGLKNYANYKILDNYLLYAMVDIFCNAKKWWECEMCWQRKRFNAVYKMNFQEEKEMLYKIPDYALDFQKEKKLDESKVDMRWSGAWKGMLWRRKCFEQGLDLQTSKWSDVKLDKEEYELFKKLDEK